MNQPATYSSNHDDSHPLPASFRVAFFYWLKLGFLSFGGPAGQIAIMHHDLVEKKRWISEKRFLHALNYCMLLPGPEAQQLATYIGWMMHRTRGGIMAGGCQPGFLGWTYRARAADYGDYLCWLCRRLAQSNLGG